MHLTNYSINKHSETYEKGQSVESGMIPYHKRTIDLRPAVHTHLASQAL